jgi:hypothetical protein
MNNFLEISILLVSTIFDHATMFLTSPFGSVFHARSGKRRRARPFL